MRPAPSFASLLCLIAGIATAAIGAVWLMVSWRNDYAPPWSHDPDRYHALNAVGLTISFDVILPFFALLSVVSGILSWHRPEAKAGLACSMAAIAVYLLVAFAPGS